MSSMVAVGQPGDRRLSRDASPTSPRVRLRLSVLPLALDEQPVRGLVARSAAGGVLVLPKQGKASVG